eukprot:CAMPEP_0201097156 /NCGR_PEP_ID=MMETSP0812-20130820/6224_1 /ASSEMBLY_ACC=CAM_ASM_000668 /TAXON_ID=98059 /ORGANISM="Dinobryon sp., Strain UTEXLB2267" /LENGTH=669 /DNA_ID=CAMNT_0047351909 /DNA_START=184 /DNA_END=2193 /DNA_ORIENTATION=-
MIQVIYVAFNLLLYLRKQMVGLSFKEYIQMHDFYRMIAVLTYACYVFGWYVHSNRMLTEKGFYEQSSQDLTAYAVGQVVMVIFITLVDSRSYMRAAEIKGEKLQVRLNLVRYISHEMRSPLNTAFMGLQLLRNDTMRVLESVRHSMSSLALEDEPPENLLQSMAMDLERVQGMLETGDLVKESSCLALETLNDMLTFDKMDEQKLVVEVDDLDVWGFVSDSVRPFAINALKAQVKLDVQCVDQHTRWIENFTIRADRFKLNQVLRNFISNALKFCRNPRGEVRVLVEHRLQEGRVVKPPGSGGSQIVRDFVRVSVEDNGAGISAENQRRLFGQYVQFDAGALQKGGGSGLGLWISKNLVELHGGVIGASSRGLGQGSTFFFELPLFEVRRSLHTQPQGPPGTSGKHRGLAKVAKVVPVDCKEAEPDLEGQQKAPQPQSQPHPPARPRRRSLLQWLETFSRPHRRRPTGAEAFLDRQVTFMDLSQLLQAPPPSSEPLPPSVVSSFEGPPRSRDGSSHKSLPPPDPATLTQPRSLSVLVVDDTASTRKVTRRLLTGLGHRVQEAADGLLFLKLMGLRDATQLTPPSSWPVFDVVLMDDNMPHLSGPEATAAVRRAGYKGLIFGVTGNAFDSQLDDFKAHGADVVFCKPLDLRALEEALRSRLPDYEPGPLT